MGWDTKRFIDPESIQDDLMCCICQEVLEEPVQAPCEHTFCQKCIQRWLDQGQETCPEDRKKLDLKSLQPSLRVTRKLLDKLTIRCKNQVDGCPLMCKMEHMQKLVQHEEKGCLAESNVSEREVDELKKMVANKDKEIAEKEATISHLRRLLKEGTRIGMEASAFEPSAPPLEILESTPTTATSSTAKAVYSALLDRTMSKGIEN